MRCQDRVVDNYRFNYIIDRHTYSHPKYVICSRLYLFWVTLGDYCDFGYVIGEIICWWWWVGQNQKEKIRATAIRFPISFSMKLMFHFCFLNRLFIIASTGLVAFIFVALCAVA